MVVFRQQNAGKNHDLLSSNKSFQMWQISNMWGRQ